MSLSLDRLYLRCMREMKIKNIQCKDLHKGLDLRREAKISDRELRAPLIGGICVRLTRKSR